MERAPEDPAGDRGSDASGHAGIVTIDLRAFEVDVPVPGGDIVRVDHREHRADVVRRLLLLGVSERTLTSLLPDWVELIGRVVDELRSPGPGSG